MATNAEAATTEPGQACDLEAVVAKQGRIIDDLVVTVGKMQDRLDGLETSRRSHQHLIDAMFADGMFPPDIRP